IQDHRQYAVQLAARKEEDIALIDEQGKLTEQLQKNLEAATKLQRVEEVYRPYRQKRRTRATIAQQKAVEPLAEQMLPQSIEHIEATAEHFFSEEHQLSKVEDVLAGANDIIAEWISDDPTYRDYIRETTWKLGTIETTVKNAEKDEKEIFKMYYEYDEAIRS